MHPAESENEALTDRRKDTWTKKFELRVLHNTPHFLKWLGIKIDIVWLILA